MKPVLYVSHSKRGLFYYNDASARYRCVFPAEELIACGDTAHTIHFSQINKVKLSNYRKIIFHRPQYSFKFKQVIKQATLQKIELWVDFDDLLFCPEFSVDSAAVQSGKMPASLARKHAKRYLKALRLFTRFQVSTDELGHQLQIKLNTKRTRSKSISRARKYGFALTQEIKVVYNKVPERWVKQAQIIPVKQRLERKIIRYLPGTSHHKHDFAHVEKFLAELLHDNPSYHLNVIGDLEFDINIFPSEQVSQTDFQPYEQLPSLINDSWIIIAPLVDNIFNRCKSGLKFWESGIFGIPVISSPLRDIERFKNKGLCISDNLLQWEKFIELMCKEEDYIEACNASLKISESAVIKQSGLENQRDYYLAMTAAYGPRWPEMIINPTIEIATFSSPPYKYIYAEVLKAIERDTPPVKNIFVKKGKKLLASPSSFFRDSAVFKALTKKG